MAQYNIEMNSYNGSTYDQLYPITTIKNVNDIKLYCTLVGEKEYAITTSGRQTGRNYINNRASVDFEDILNNAQVAVIHTYFTLLEGYSSSSGDDFLGAGLYLALGANISLRPEDLEDPSANQGLFINSIRILDSSWYTRRNVEYYSIYYPNFYNTGRNGLFNFKGNILAMGTIRNIKWLYVIPSGSTGGINFTGTVTLSTYRLNI